MPVENNPLENPIVDPNPIEPPKEPVVETPPAPPTPAQPVSIEEEIAKMGGNVMKIPAIQSLIEEARKQEKDKLYKALEEKDTKNKDLANTIENLQKQINDSEGTKMADEKDLLLAIQTLQEQQAKLLAENEAEKERTRLAKLESFKATQIASAKGEIIESLVNGSTEEAILASVEVAKQEYLKIVSPFKQQLEEATKPNPINAPTPHSPNIPTQQLEYTGEQIKSMSPTEYAQYRERILSGLKK